MNSTPTKFQIALPVADLPRSIAFYRLLFGTNPALASNTSARFEAETPPLALTLTKAEAGPERTLNHLGFRMPDQVALVALQRRLEEAGIATQRQEGVECCYALQTKFWVTDPDKHLWELYILHGDLDHSGFDDPKTQQPWRAQAEPRTWTHALTAPIPERIGFADASLDEVCVEGTFNGPRDDGKKQAFLSEIARVLRPGGTVAIHGMAGDRPFPGTPAFPGIAALVQHVPTVAELTEQLHNAGFGNLFLEKCDSVCLSVPGVELREIRLLATRPESTESASAGYVMYRGPFAEVTDDDGAVYRRGDRVLVRANVWSSLRSGMLADQFVFFASR
jgi:catechol 2,3-dioxygenase-like lactoylglutathione lyase family enzyme